LPPLGRAQMLRVPQSLGLISLQVFDIDFSKPGRAPHGLTSHIRRAGKKRKNVPFCVTSLRELSATEY
jgi:hypothetical protein